MCSHSPPRARTSYTLRDAGNNKMHVQRLASLGSNTRQVRRCPRATLDTIKPESYLSSHPRTSTSCIAVSCMWPSTTCTFWLAYVSTYDLGLVLASSPIHAGSPILCVACMYTWPLPLHTRASSTSRACDSARLTHSARTLHLASTVAHTSKLDLSRMRFGTTYTFCSHTRASQPASVTHIRASTPCTHHWHRQQRATRIFGLHVRATEAYIPCPHTRTNTR